MFATIGFALSARSSKFALAFGCIRQRGKAGARPPITCGLVLIKEQLHAARELALERRRFTNQAEARMAIFEFIEGWYNSRRRHSALDMKSPIEYESSHLGVTQDTSPDLSTETG